MTGEATIVPDDSLTIQEQEISGGRSRRFAKFLGRIANQTETSIEHSDEFYEALGDTPDELAAAWESFDELKQDTVVNTSLEACFKDYVTLLNTVLPRRKGSSRLKDTDYATFASLFIEAGRVMSGRKAAADHATQSMHEHGFTNSLMDTIRKNKELLAITRGVFNISDIELRPDEVKVKDAAEKAFNALSDKSKTVYSEVAKQVHKTLRKFDRKLTDGGPEHALWMVELVVQSGNGGHQLRGKQALADQLISEFVFNKNSSLLARALTLVENYAESGGLITSFANEKLRDNEGDNVHEFYRTTLNMTPDEFVSHIAKHFSSLPTAMKKEYLEYSRTAISEMRTTIMQIERSRKTNYGPVVLDEAINAAARLFKKAHGSLPVGYSPSVSLSPTVQKTTRTTASAKGSEAVRPLTANTAPKIKRDVVVYKKTPSGYAASDISYEDALVKAIGNSSRSNHATVENLTHIIKDITESRRFKRGVQQIESAGNIRLVGERNEATKSLYSVYPGRYPGISGSKEFGDCRITFVIGDDEQIIIIGVYKTHKEYDAALRNG